MNSNNINLPVFDYRKDSSSLEDFRIVPSNVNVIIADRATAETELLKAIKSEDYAAINHALKSAELMLSPADLAAIYDSVESLPDNNKQWFRRNFGKPTVLTIEDGYGGHKAVVTNSYYGGDGE